VLSRLHAGPYRVLYEVGEATIWVRRVDRVL
jgi:mRNA-degrading endonuclease RelE of RelBE toxin-antitoxin system